MRPTITSLLLFGSALSCQASGAGDPIVTGDGSATDGTGATEGTGATGPDDADGGTSVGGTDGEPVDCEAVTCESWCDEATWGGSVPTAETDVVVPDGKVVLLDCSAEAKTLTIDSGGAVKASRSTSSSLTVHGNVIVWGRLDLGTEDDRIPAGVASELVFAGMRDDDYVGTPSTVFGGEDFTPPVDTPLEILDTDVGLWVMGRGVLTAAGELKQAWSTLTDGTAPGDSTLSVDDATGWQPDDRVVLTPTAEVAQADFADQFDEATIASVSGTEVTLASATAFEHAGCSDCVRRGEAANLTRNVVVRSLDDTAHAHVIVGEEGVVQLDSVELRWLGPLRDCTGADEPARRSPLRFHQQGDASEGSFVRHTAIWASGKDGIAIEHSNGIEVTDVVVYDTQETAVSRFYDNSACGLRCIEVESFVPRDADLTHVLAARVAVPNRVEDCAAIGGAVAIFAGGGDTLDSVVTGTAYNYGSFGNEAAFHWSESIAGASPADRFEGNVAHDNAGNGLSNWQNNTVNDTPYTASAWSNGSHGFLHGAYGNSISYQDLVAIDNAGLGFAIKGVNQDEIPRITGATMDNVGVVDYTFVPESPLVLGDVTFTGDRSPAFTQIHDACSGGDETDPQDGECIFAWLRIENPVFPPGVVPFDFGWHQNRNTVWEVRGFSHPDYPSLPTDFDLYRADNMVEGGSYNEDFDAWLVPR